MADAWVVVAFELEDPGDDTSMCSLKDLTVVVHSDVHHDRRCDSTPDGLRLWGRKLGLGSACWSWAAPSSYSAFF